ncbi:MAG: division/cell wall cluster transcriptional repressor MraZ [bacterium]
MDRKSSNGYHFIGEYEHNVDSKNRVILPSAIRNELEDDARLILAPAIEPCLVLFPYERWEKFLMSEELQGNTVDSRKFRRALASKANETRVDSQGRILIPDDLKDIAEINDTVTVVGNVDRVELWTPEQLDEYQRSIPDEELKEIEEKMFSGRGS